MSKRKHLLIGVGEVGSALKKILERKTDLFWFDINPKINSNLPKNLKKIDVLHITIPQNKDFIKTCKKFIKLYSPNLTVIHSTTILGTTNKLGPNAVHSPILGQHNDLYKHIKTFKKAIGPNSESSKRLAEKYLKKIFKLEFYANSQTTELAKLASLSRFALSIEFSRYLNDLCKINNIKYQEINDQFIKLYNEGYKHNNLDKFIQPILEPPLNKIGGTCVCPGVIKLAKAKKSPLLDFIIDKNFDRKAR